VARALLAGSAIVVVVSLGVILFSDGSSPPDVGRREERMRVRPDHVPALQMSIATDDWGLTGIDLGGADPLAGGLALVDVDGDGDLDVVAANGGLAILRWDGLRFVGEEAPGYDDIVAVASRDVDVDGWVDLVLARQGPEDLVIWGHDPTQRRPFGVDSSPLPGGEPSSLVLPVDLDGDGVVELVRLGRGGSAGSEDVVWRSGGPGAPREFVAEVLPDSERMSLAAAVADVDLDGRLDIWVTRDVGWDLGGDSVYSFVDGVWIDRADELQAALAIDGMGVAIADFDGDGSLDGYVSDIGENDLLVRRGSVFRPAGDLGLGRIRPPDAPADVVSSSWGAGAADLNLDGRLDLIVTGGGFPDSTVRNKIAGTSVVDAEPPGLYLGLGDGTYVDGWPELGLDLETVGRVIALGDVDGDGDTDVLLLSRYGRIVALRNDSLRPALRVTVAEACGDGVIFRSVGDPGGRAVGLMTVVPGQTYGGQLPREFVVGSTGGVRVELRGPAGNLVHESAAGGEGRTTAHAAC